MGANRRRTVYGLLGAAALALALAGLGRWADRPGGLLVLQYLDHPVALAGGALALLLVTGVVAARKAVHRIICATSLSLLAVPAFGLLLFVDVPEKIQSDAAPGREDRRLVVMRGSAMIDPLWWVYVDEGSGLTTRRWQVVYFNGDWSDFRRASWVGPDQVSLQVGDQVHLIRVGESGRPERTVVEG